MNDTDSRTLEPSENPEAWVMLEMETETHVYPNFGPKHQTKNCWCRPEMGYDMEKDVPLYSHRELH